MDQILNTEHRHWRDRIFLITWLAGVVISNTLMGSQPSLSAFFILGCLRAAGQSTGWPGLVKNMACWFRQKERGMEMAGCGTNYFLGGLGGAIHATDVLNQHFFFLWHPLQHPEEWMWGNTFTDGGVIFNGTEPQKRR